MLRQLLSSTALRLIAAIAAGIAAGLSVTLASGPFLEAMLQALMIAKHITGQVILFMVPLIIFGCVAPSITRFSGNVTSMLGFALFLAYASSVGAAFLAIGASRWIVPALDIPTSGAIARQLPDTMLITLNFPTADTMSVLLLAILLGLGTVWTRFKMMGDFLEGFQRMVLAIVRKILLPVLPLFVGTNFALIAYKGQLEQMKVFVYVLAMIVGCQLIWLALLYIGASAGSGRNGWKVLRAYPKAYFTALGTMSSAATLPFALECIASSRMVRKDTYDFSIPLFSNLHLCGSVIAEISLVTAVYYTMFHELPSLADMIAFALLACVIAIGSPGVPGGLNMSCMTIVGSMILSGRPIEEATEFFGIMTAIYTVQDGFGTACNVTGDGALTLLADSRVPAEPLAEET